MIKSKTRTIGKWHGLQNSFQQTFDSPAQLTKQHLSRRWSVDRNLNVTRLEVLQ